MTSRLHNLLSGEQKRAIRYLYLARVGAVGATILSVAFIVCIFALLPTYMGIQNELASLRVDVEQRANGLEDKTDLEKRSERIKSFAMTLTPYAQESNTTRMVSAVLMERPASVRVKGITYDVDARMVTVEGVAETRSEYLRYESALKKREDVVRVERPISIFEGGANIQFRIQVFFAEQ
ncbi:hypothetical protein LDC_2134 [sediment metagenome]|uniref:Uncharacterized protein n=1 Tax=sediment metagenome TaxID=749907 RepID=D9PKR5_9ZZZZ